MGLPEGHAEKDGVLVDMTQLVPEMKRRLAIDMTSRVAALGLDGDSGPAPKTGDDGV